MIKNPTTTGNLIPNGHAISLTINLDLEFIHTILISMILKDYSVAYLVSILGFMSIRQHPKKTTINLIFTN